MGLCKICKKEKNLIKKSHIISKLLFRDLFEYNPKRSIIQFDLLNQNKPLKTPSDVLYDNGLFCLECDGNKGMGFFEDYFKKYISKPKIKLEHKTGLDWFIYSKYNFDTFFLFFNIQIYRASLSNRPEFNMVNIEYNILEKIRINIIKKKVINKTNEIAILKLSKDSNFKNSICSFKKMGNNYSILLREFIVLYFFDLSSDLFLRIKGHTIKKQELIVPVIPKEVENNFIKNILGI